MLRRAKFLSPAPGLPILIVGSRLGHSLLLRMTTDCFVVVGRKHVKVDNDVESLA